MLIVQVPLVNIYLPNTTEHAFSPRILLNFPVHSYRFTLVSKCCLEESKCFCSKHRVNLVPVHLNDPNLFCYIGASLSNLITDSCTILAMWTFKIVLIDFQSGNKLHLEGIKNCTTGAKIHTHQSPVECEEY